MTDAERLKNRVERVIRRITGHPDMIGHNGKRLSGEIITLLRRQHRAMVRMVRKRSHEYMKDASDSKLSKAMQASAASKAWAFKDFADDLAALAKRGARKKD